MIKRIKRRGNKRSARDSNPQSSAYVSVTCDCVTLPETDVLPLH